MTKTSESLAPVDWPKEESHGTTGKTESEMLAWLWLLWEFHDPLNVALVNFCYFLWMPQHLLCCSQFFLCYIFAQMLIFPIDLAWLFNLGWKWILPDIFIKFNSWVMGNQSNWINKSRFILNTTFLGGPRESWGDHERKPWSRDF